MPLLVIARERPMNKCKKDIKMDITEIGCEKIWIHLAKRSPWCRAGPTKNDIELSRYALN
jgi:hypothetical protein